MPDYTLRATADTTYLKLRKNTYLVAVKASRMETSASFPAWREEELEEVLVKITENDADFCSGGRRPWQSPGRKERSESVWSTISLIKSRLATRTNNSFNNIEEERGGEISGNDMKERSIISRRPVLSRGQTMPACQANLSSERHQGQDSLH